MVRTSYVYCSWANGDLFSSDKNAYPDAYELKFKQDTITVHTEHLTAWNTLLLVAKFLEGSLLVWHKIIDVSEVLASPIITATTHRPDASSPP
jgi:hypothetical protein